MKPTKLRRSARSSAVAVVTLLLMIVGAYVVSRLNSQTPTSFVDDSESAPGSQETVSSHVTNLLPVVIQAATTDASSVPTASSAASSADSVPADMVELSIAWRQSAEKLQDLAKCYRAEDCPAEETEVRSYDQIVQGQVVTELNRIRDLAVQFQGVTGGVLAPEAQEVGRYFFVNGGDDIKDAAAELLAYAPVSDENIHAFIKGMQRTTDPDILDKVLDKLKEAKGNPEVSQFVMQMIKRATPQAANEFARYALDHMTKENLSEFKAIRDELPHRTRRFQYVDANIEEKEIQINGG
jgi:hypothetical protein